MNTKLLKLEPIVQMMLRQEAKDSAPNTLIAYILWITLGVFGGHHFYIAAKSMGRSRIVHVIVGFIYMFTLGMGFLGWLIDVLGTMLYCSMVRKENEEVIVDEWLKVNGS